MLRPTEARAEEARKNARQLFVRDRDKEAEVVKEREKQFAAQTGKTARLKALRLARDAESQAAAAAAVAAEPASTAAKTKKPAKRKAAV